MNTLLTWSNTLGSSTYVQDIAIIKDNQGG